MLNTIEAKKKGPKKPLKLAISPTIEPKESESDLATSDNSLEHKTSFDMKEIKERKSVLKLVLEPKMEQSTQKSTPEKHFFDFGLTFNPPNERDPESAFYNYHKYDQICDTSIRKCNRVSQEDRFTSKVFLRDTKEEIFLGVFDGHRNSEVSFILSQVLGLYIINHKDYENNTKKAIIEAHEMLDNEILKYQRQSDLEGGSTSLSVLIKKDMLYISNVGDSLGFSFGQDGVKQITREHKPSNPEERLKLESKGAFVTETRQNVHRLLGGITISRSFGDPGYKEFMTSEPDVYCFTAQDLEKIDYILIGTDGVWEFLDPPDLQNLLKEWRADKGNEIKFLSEFLVDHAVDKGRERKKDNMTLMVINIESIRRDFMMGTKN